MDLFRPSLDRLLSETAREISSKVGIFCLSKRFDSLPMWAHYAANATGYAVEFTGLECVFVGDSTGVLRQPREVVYEQEIEGVTFDPRSHESLFLSKYNDWSYEREVRVVLPLTDCRRIPLSTGTLFLYDLPPQTVRSIILGWKMQNSSAEVIREAVRELCPSVKVVRAQFRRGKVTVVDDSPA